MVDRGTSTHNYPRHRKYALGAGGAVSTAEGGTPATVALGRARIPYTLHTYAHDDTTTAYGAESAAQLGVGPERVFKTLIVDTGDGLAVGIVPVTARLDLKAIARALGVKRVGMADPAKAARSTGYVLGGISPMGQRAPLPTVLDLSAAAFDTICVSAGRRGLQVELAPDDLLMITGAELAEIATS